MPESTRTGFVGNMEIHLKKRIEITSEIVDQIATLPSGDPWYVIGKNTNTGNWQFEQSFDSFEDAEQRFIAVCGNNGVNAGRLGVGGAGENGRMVGR